MIYDIYIYISFFSSFLNLVQNSSHRFWTRLHCFRYINLYSEKFLVLPSLPESSYIAAEGS